MVAHWEFGRRGLLRGRGAADSGVAALPARPRLPAPLLMCEVLCSLAGPRPPQGPEPLQILLDRSPALEATEEELAELSVALRAALLPCLHEEAYRECLLQLRVSLQFCPQPLFSHFPAVLEAAARALIQGGVEMLDRPEVRSLEEPQGRRLAVVVLPRLGKVATVLRSQ